METVGVEGSDDMAVMSPGTMVSPGAELTIVLVPPMIVNLTNPCC